MPWTNPAAQRCRAELALNASSGVFGRFFPAHGPHQLDAQAALLKTVVPEAPQGHPGM